MKKQTHKIIYYNIHIMILILVFILNSTELFKYITTNVVVNMWLEQRNISIYERKVTIKKI